jgi:hypothetical protein
MEFGENATAEERIVTIVAAVNFIVVLLIGVIEAQLSLMKVSDRATTLKESNGGAVKTLS